MNASEKQSSAADAALATWAAWGSSARDQAEEAITSQEAFEKRALAEDEVRRFREALKLPAWPYTQAPWPYAPAPSASSASAASKPSAD